MKWITFMNDTNYQSSVKKRENLNGTISVTEIEFVVKNFSTKKKYYEFCIDSSRKFNRKGCS